VGLEKNDDDDDDGGGDGKSVEGKIRMAEKAF
jgi:hypothetical protein